MTSRTICSCVLLAVLSACSPRFDTATSPDFNKNWDFSLNQGEWSSVDLPHDWSVSFPFDSIKGEGATGYLLGGHGKYRKTFATTGLPVTYLYFDGVYNNATVSLNGEKLGFHPYGYSPFHYDISQKVNASGKSNELMVEVDRSRYADSRWYTGSGIYREVKLINEPALHVPPWGISVTTPEVSAAMATVRVKTKLVNKGAGTQDATLVTRLVDEKGNTVATQTTPVQLKAGAEQTLEQEITVTSPALWDVDAPNLYTAVSELKTGKEAVREYRTSFGIRSFRFDAATGFYLNGVNRKIKGVCLHHDGGLVGAAVPKAVWRRRLQTLKDGGCNAIRSAHNPASEEFLSLCDEMGFLVQDEFYDEWDYPKDKRKNMGESSSTDYITRGHHEHFQEWSKTDLQNTILAHRNHPSIIQWSIGNEIEWTYPRQKETTGFFGADANGNYFWNPPPYSTEKIKELQETIPRTKYQIGETAQKLADWTREIDTTRPVIANCILPSASYESGYADALDIIGFSYRRIMYDYAKENYPDLPVMGTENLGQYHEWKAVMERPWISGTFLWTGIDYLGESNGNWPQKHSSSGLLDLAGFPTPSYYMYKSLWTKEPMVYLTSQTLDKSIFKVEDKRVVERKPGGWKHALWSWHDVNHHWNYEDGETVIIEALSNCPEAELFLNGKSLGRQRLADNEDHIYKWAVPYTAGEVVVKAYADGKVVEYTLRTSAPPATVHLSTDGRLEGGIEHIIVELRDKNGNPVRHADREITFTASGAELLGVDNGAPSNTYAFQGGKVKTNNGKALAILRLKEGTSKLTVSASGLPDKTISLSSRRGYLSSALPSPSSSTTTN
ncbi:glycoside hydrolase family 2 TIM barrel-domain containing protein [Neolewinella aurantiaca]|uniref:glycoside hydrolase family 2 TIM barrel-domain containing protein n=1 Tax=Neolewinella aurantiaca TaxID=2602767 RepID=UPI001FE49717|nr:glycoside hydrolase family 2 TIM barrel-domain containing protein [Neolewinella aurantiaca]